VKRLMLRNALSLIYRVLIAYETLDKLITAAIEKADGQKFKEIFLTEMKTTLIPNCLCIISRYPFFLTFSKILKSLYKNLKESLEYPLEYYVSCLVCCVPLPPRGFYDVELQLGPSFPSLLIKQPPANQLPLLDIDFCLLPQHLSIENTIKTINVILLEQNVLFVSSKPYSITCIIEIVLALMLPFEHQMVYIPLLPDSMLEFLTSPVPFVSGIDISLLPAALDAVYRGTCIVNLDNDTVSFKGENPMELHEKSDNVELLPKHETDKLIKKLKDIW